MNREPEQKIIDDAEWAELMEGEYRSQGYPLDQVGQARVWRRMHQHIKSEKQVSRVRNYGPWMGLAVSVMVTVGVMYLRSTNDRDWREKGTDGSSIPAHITPYVLGDDGSTRPVIDSRISKGSTVVFKVWSATPGVYALLVSEDGEAPRLAHHEYAPIQTEDQLVIKEGAVYGIKINKSFRACIIARDKEADLSESIEGAKGWFSQSSHAQCLALEATIP